MDIEEMSKKIPVAEVWEPVIDRAKYWWKSALKREHPFDKFMSGWISFNIIYNFITRKNNINRGGELKRVELAVKSLFIEGSWSGDLENSIKKLMDYDVGAGIWYRDLSENWVSTDTIRNDIRQALVEKKNVEALVKTYEIIYRVRCNLFHGDKSDDNLKDLNVVTLCWEVMRHSYPAMLKAQF